MITVKAQLQVLLEHSKSLVTQPKDGGVNYMFSIIVLSDGFGYAMGEKYHFDGIEYEEIDSIPQHCQYCLCIGVETNEEGICSDCVKTF